MAAYIHTSAILRDENQLMSSQEAYLEKWDFNFQQKKKKKGPMNLWGVI